MPTSFIIQSTSGAEPLSLDTDVKPWLRVDGDEENALLADLITGVRRYAEQQTRLALISQSVQALIQLAPARVGTLSGPVGYPAEPFPISERAGSLGGMTQFYLKLPVSPALSITTVEYQLTPFGVPEWTTLPAQDASLNDNYRLDLVTVPAHLYFAGLLAARRFRITYTAGYTPGALPGDVKTPMLKLVAWRYLYREGGDCPPDIAREFELLEVKRL